MPKPTKIKRYHRMYRRHRPVSSLLVRGVVAVAAVCILGFIGWSAYGPVMEFLSGERTPRNTASAVSSGVQGDAPAPVEPVPAEPVPPVPERMRAVYAPPAALSSMDALEKFVQGIGVEDVNAVMFDLKDLSGNVLYRSKSETVSKIGAQVAGAYDLAAVCAKLAEFELLPIGRLQTFRDPLAASKLTGSGVTYMNSEMLWLDNSREAGGKPWLNPYSDKARAYLSELALEAVSMGVKQVLLDNVNFPMAFGGLEFATYGEKTATMSRAEALAGFVEELDAKLPDEECELSVYLTGISALGLNDMYFGGSPFDVCGSNLTLGVSPEQFGESFTIEGLTLPAPASDPGGTVTALLGALEAKLAGRTVSGLVSANVDSGSNVQIAALDKSGITREILYSVDGIYQ